MVVIHRFFASALSFAVVATTVHARAERTSSPCELRWESASVPDEWSDALRDVRSFVARLTAENTDCRTIAVSPDDEGATVSFTTADGRTARRRIGAPRELRGLVEALLVSSRDPAPMPLPSSPPETPVATAGATTAESAPKSLVAFEAGDASRPSSAQSDAPGLLLGAGAGVKGSFPRDVIAGVGQVFAGATFARLMQSVRASHPDGDRHEASEAS